MNHTEKENRMQYRIITIWAL